MARYSKLNRLYLDDKLEISKVITIQGDQFNYLKSVMRAKHEMEYRVFNSIDGEFIANIRDISRRYLDIEVTEKLRDITESPLCILAMSIIKPDKFIQAATWASSFGIKMIVPIITQNTQHHEINKERLRRCLIETIEQSERFHIPEIAPNLGISDFLKYYMNEEIFFADEHHNISQEGSAITMNNIVCIKNIRPTNAPIILIGPEGGFTKTERVDLLKMHNLKSICLGESILRSEIAAGTAVALVQLLRSRSSITLFDEGALEA